MIKDGDAAGPTGDQYAGRDPRPRSAANCDVRQSARTFVGFESKQSLDDFDQTAAEAERVLSMSKLALCRLSPAQDKDGTLRAALAGGVVEITAVRFARADLSEAVLNLQTAPEDGGPASPLETRWLLRVTRAADAWQVVSAVRQKAKRR